MTEQERPVCTTPGCHGDGRYAAPGKGHIGECRYPLDPVPFLPAITDPEDPTNTDHTDGSATNG